MAKDDHDAVFVDSLMQEPSPILWALRALSNTSLYLEISDSTYEFPPPVSQPSRHQSVKFEIGPLFFSFCFSSSSAKIRWQ
ncbi:Protein of unknown function [Pyronema omphalodes CBS 100304]|uniref:Uncharacterized protein n=1 Tax=Pyronema omphalodes (strain CBS 100304) TaxID=1076935 RepID=U4LE30_PYROM|nr:Protein of unknown function [Pyronema omphalodes CBS 100304]